jgi:hypothetical protein
VNVARLSRERGIYAASPTDCKEIYTEIERSVRSIGEAT